MRTTAEASHVNPLPFGVNIPGRTVCGSRSNTTVRGKKSDAQAGAPAFTDDAGESMDSQTTGKGGDVEGDSSRRGHDLEADGEAQHAGSSVDASTTARSGLNKDEQQLVGCVFS